MNNIHKLKGDKSPLIKGTTIEQLNFSTQSAMDTLWRKVADIDYSLSQSDSSVASLKTDLTEKLVTKKLVVNGLSIFNNDLYVSDGINISGDIYSQGNAYFLNDVSINGSLGATDITAWETLTSLGTLGVSGNTYASGNLTVSGISTLYNDLGVSGNIDVSGGIKFNTLLEEYPTASGTLFFDNRDKTLSVVLENSTLQIGQEQYIVCVNKTGSDIPNGSVVFVNGAQGNRPTISLADADNYDEATCVIGVTTQLIADDAVGMVTTTGLVRDLNTSSFTEGDRVYLSTTAGQFTATRPINGKIRIVVGIIVKSHVVDGWLCVKIDNDRYMFGDPQNGNYTKFEDDGTIVMYGNARTHEDLNFDVLNSGGPAAFIPDPVTINDVIYREFTSSNNQYCGGVKEIPHSTYLGGQTLIPHLHLFLKSGESSGTTGVTFNMCWDLRQTSSITSGNINVSATSAQLAASGNMFIIYAASGFNCPTSLHGQLAMKIARVSGDAGDIVVTTYGVHVENDMFGSRTTTTK